MTTGYGINPGLSASSVGVDSDHDGLTDEFEKLVGTNSAVADTDGDGLPDSLEVTLGLNPDDADTDHDGISDSAELRYGLNPLVADVAAPTGAGGIGDRQHRNDRFDRHHRNHGQPAAPGQPERPAAPDTTGATGGTTAGDTATAGTTGTADRRHRHGDTRGPPTPQQPPARHRRGTATGPAPNGELTTTITTTTSVDDGDGKPTITTTTTTITSAPGSTVIVGAPPPAAPGPRPRRRPARTRPPPPATAAHDDPTTGTTAPPQPTGSGSHDTIADPTGGSTGHSSSATEDAVAKAKAIDDKFVKVALAQQGDAYVWGADPGMHDSDPHDFDCSALTEWSAYQTGVDLPRTSYDQFLYFKQHGLLIPVSEATHIKGALLFEFSSEPTPGGGRPDEAHVAISLGDGKSTIEAADTAEGVLVKNHDSRFNYAAILPGTQAALDDPSILSGWEPGSPTTSPRPRPRRRRPSRWPDP